MGTADDCVQGDRGVVSAWNFIAAIPTWQRQAACRGQGPDEFFQERRPGNNAVSAAARRVCAVCPVLAECLDYGLEEIGGIWGGVGESQRRAFVRARRSRPHGPDEARGCSCTWCQLLRVHLARLDGDGEALIDSNGTGATHGRRVTYNRGCRCEDGGCLWSASATAQALTRAKVDTSQHWSDHAGYHGDYGAARDAADRAAVTVLAARLGPLFAHLAGTDVATVVQACEVVIDERIAKSRRPRPHAEPSAAPDLAVAESPAVPPPSPLPFASPDPTGHGRTMAA